MSIKEYVRAYFLAQNNEAVDFNVAENPDQGVSFQLNLWSAALNHFSVTEVTEVTTAWHLDNVSRSVRMLYCIFHSRKATPSTWAVFRKSVIFLIKATVLR